jgi:hypothetical protein
VVEVVWKPFVGFNVDERITEASSSMWLCDEVEVEMLSEAPFENTVVVISIHLSVKIIVRIN